MSLTPAADVPRLARHALLDGRVLLSGTQALVRLPLDQHRRDTAAGLRTQTFITGYPGSPLASYDLALGQSADVLAQHGVLHVPGQNEELAATALMGTQMLDDHPHAQVDGVIGIWYGKGPGLDRAGDALKHGNFAGTSRYGAVVILSGEDHEAKSSTLPYQQDYAFQSAGIPILYPSSVAEFLEFGLHAIALSRYSGCWVALKLVAPLCDGSERVAVAREHPEIVLPALDFDGRPFRKQTDFRFYPGINIATERQLYRERHAAVRAYARANHLDRIVAGGEHDRLGIVSAGKSYADTMQALNDLGFDDAALRAAGVRILRVGTIYPTDDELIRQFANGLDEIVVVEEKRDFLEARVKMALNGLERGVRVVGKEDDDGRPFFPVEGAMDADVIAQTLSPRLQRYTSVRTVTRVDAIAAIRDRRYPMNPKRTPNYCSGCPHNVSTRHLPHEVAWGSPGCHAFASIIEQPERHIDVMTQLGGEGVPWIGLAPFTERAHINQNVGDGSLFHSSYLNIRFAVTAKSNITFRILYNGAVANTGAQEAVGHKTVPELAQLFAIEGVAAVAILTKDPTPYRRAALPSIATVHDVDAMDRVMRDFEKRPGVTVMIYDESCANERRRKQKRGTLPPANTFVVVNEDVCENCGDCGVKTNCMSLHKVETTFGEKTQIHQSSCNQDQTCLTGDCPAFVTVTTNGDRPGFRKPKAPPLELEIPEPLWTTERREPYAIYTPGVGGTGVITLNAILAQAACLDGKHVLSYDQTGAAQKWGPVLSSVVIADPGTELRSNKVGLGRADLYLALDVMAAADRVNLDRCDPSRTVAVINTALLPSGEMIRDVNLRVDPSAMVDTIEAYTMKDRAVHLDARRVAEELFGDYMMTNMVALGAAYQSGLVPISGRSIETAVRLNRVAVEQNLLAFRYGRLAVFDEAALRERVGTRARPLADVVSDAAAKLSPRERRGYDLLLRRLDSLDETSRALAEPRVVDLISYQSVRYARDYVEFIVEVASRAQTIGPASREGVMHGAIRNLHKLMAYKDEYGVARLQIQPSFHANVRGLFTGRPRLAYNLHPPLLRALGLKKKIRLGEWFTPGLRVLALLKGLRGTPFDVFGYTTSRRTERSLQRWYRDTLSHALECCTPATYGLVEEIASAPEMIRGYDDIKLRAVTATKTRVNDLLARLEQAPSGDRSLAGGGPQPLIDLLQ